MPAPAQTAPTPPPPGTRRMNRDDVVALGQGGKPWEFLPVAARVLNIAPGDAGLRFLAGANLARLGLRTPAAEQLDLIPAGTGLDVGAMREALANLPPDVIPLTVLREMCRDNVEALAARGVDLRGRLEEWEARAANWQFLRCLDGNIVRRKLSGEPGDMGQWLALADLTGAAKGFAAQHFRVGTTERPAVIEGIDPPWLLLEVHRATPARKDGARQRLTVVQASELEFLNGLCQHDLRDLIAEPGIGFFVGPGAGERLGAHLRERFEYRIAGPCIPLTTLREQVSPGVDAIVRGACIDQQREMARLKSAAGAIYAGRDEAWWSARYRRAMAGRPEAGGRTEPLRVLVPTCRYSTFIQHSSRDLVAAFAKAGCDARLLIEPDDASHFSALAYLRQFVQFKPDLVVLINYTRANLGDFLPAQVPWVCWVQDAMPHLYDGKIGAAQGRLDFLAGHLPRELFEQFGYPRQRTLAVPVVASTLKFHCGSVDGGLRRRHECEIAFVSHQSETPEALHNRLMVDARSDAALRRILERLWPRAHQIAAGCALWHVTPRLREAAREEAVREHGREPDPRLVTMLMAQYCKPLADRAVRHQMLGWAAEIAERRGWRLHVYGRGWDRHERVSRYAKGELAHGEELRASYQCAAAHLHASINTLVHQRVMECALSGGLPLCRRQLETVAVATWRAQRAAALGRHPQFCDMATRRPGYAVGDCAEAMALTALLQRLGLPHESSLWIGHRERELLVEFDALAKPECDAAWLLVDMAETTFTSGEELERCVERAVAGSGWRDAMSGAIARRVRERLTHGVLAEQIVRLVRESLEPSATEDISTEVTPPSGPEPVAPTCGAATRFERLHADAAAPRALCDRFGRVAAERWLRRVAEVYAPPAWARGAITLEDALFLYEMVRRVCPGRVIEIGTASGASTALLLTALADAGVAATDERGSPTLHSFDLFPTCYFDRSRPVGSAVAEMAPALARGLAVHTGKTAVDAGTMFAQDPAALAFIDGDHRHPWPTADLLALLPALRPGAWVVLHDIELPEYARRYEAAHGTVVDWHHTGAALLFDAWPYEKLRGTEEAFNIGAIRVPETGAATVQDLGRVIDIPWEAAVDERTRRVLGRE